MAIYIFLPVLVITAGGIGFFLYLRSNKGAEKKAHHQEATLKALKMRYMNGEITEEEYNELVAARKA